MPVPFNFLGIFLSAVASMILGFVWYGPLFGKEWMKLNGFSAEKMKNMTPTDMAKNYGITFLGSMMTAFVMSHLVAFAGAFLNMSGASIGLNTAFWTWFGFVAPVTFGTVLWDRKPVKLWVINNGYFLIMFLITGVILTTV